MSPAASPRAESLPLISATADFAAASAPKISVCSARDLIALTPDDIINKLRMFLYVISSLFGLMHISAMIAYRRDAFDRSVVLRKLQDPQQCLFERHGPEGAWTWLLTQDAAPEGADVFHLAGCAPLPPNAKFSGCVSVQPRCLALLQSPALGNSSSDPLPPGRS